MFYIVALVNLDCMPRIVGYCVNTEVINLFNQCLWKASVSYDQVVQNAVCHLTMVLIMLHFYSDKPLKRGLSKVIPNEQLVSMARDLLNRDAIPESEGTEPVCFLRTPIFTFQLPNLDSYPEDFKAFLHQELIETSILVSLEQSGMSF